MVIEFYKSSAFDEYTLVVVRKETKAEIQSLQIINKDREKIV